MSSGREGTADAGRGRKPSADRTHQIERERAMVEEALAHLKADERRLTLQVAALQDDRDEIGRELAEAHERVASLDAAVTAQELGLMVKERELGASRDRLEDQRELMKRVEREIEAHRSQITSAQRRLEDLVEDVVRIQHKMLRAARSERDDHG